MENKTFNDLGLNKLVMESINYMGFKTPSEIQSESIPVILNGSDIIGQAQTGTGKTLAFGAPIISKLNKSNQKIHALILTPTRELAIQITDELHKISKYSKTHILSVYGGEPIERQIRMLKKGIDVVVGTPGRILDHINRKSINLNNIDFLVLDEADEMLNMGFIDDIESIIKNTNKNRQTLLFSATMPKSIKKLASKYMKKDIKHICILKNTLTVDKIKQFYYEINLRNKFDTLCKIIDIDEPTRALIFCKTKKGVDELVEKMQSKSYNVEGMHGDMSQNKRLSTLKKFKKNNLKILVATDVAARGIDVKNISHVINYNLPQDTESYVHRIGRTGRANKEGTAYSLITSREHKMLKQIEKFTKSKIKRKEIPTIEEIYEVKHKNILNSLKEIINKKDFKEFIPLATELNKEFNLIDTTAALIKTLFNKKINCYNNNSTKNDDTTVRLFFSLGKMDKINPKMILEFLSNTSKINTKEIGDIDILTKFTFINVPKKFVNTILKHSNNKKLNGKKLNIEIAKSKKTQKQNKVS